METYYLGKGRLFLWNNFRLGIFIISILNQQIGDFALIFNRLEIFQTNWSCDKRIVMKNEYLWSLSFPNMLFVCIPEKLKLG